MRKENTKTMWNNGNTITTKRNKIEASLSLSIFTAKMFSSIVRKCVCEAGGERKKVSNLNRQFLFRKDNVGKPKSVTAGAAAQAMNPAFNVQALEVPRSAHEPPPKTLSPLALIFILICYCCCCCSSSVPPLLVGTAIRNSLWIQPQGVENASYYFSPQLSTYCKIVISVVLGQATGAESVSISTVIAKLFC